MKKSKSREAEFEIPAKAVQWATGFVLFRILGESMEPDWRGGSMQCFQPIRSVKDCIAGRAYFVETNDGMMMFKILRRRRRGSIELSDRAGGVWKIAVENIARIALCLTEPIKAGAR